MAIERDKRAHDRRRCARNGCRVDQHRAQRFRSTGTTVAARAAFAVGAPRSAAATNATRAARATHRVHSSRAEQNILSLETNRATTATRATTTASSTAAGSAADMHPIDLGLA